MFSSATDPLVIKSPPRPHKYFDEVDINDRVTSEAGQKDQNNKVIADDLVGDGDTSAALDA